MLQAQASSTRSLLEQTLFQLIDTYNDSTPCQVAYYEGIPDREALTAIKASRFPTVIQGAIDHFDALQRWTMSYLRATMGEQTVTCACTPSGEADSIQGAYFVEPHERQCTLNEMLDWIKQPTGACRYLQLQNGSLHLEFQPLAKDVDANGPSWATDVFGSDPLVNIWIGNHLSKTSLHHDSFENLFCQIRGCKRFILYPPTQYHLLCDGEYQMAKYAPASNDDENTFEIVPVEPATCVSWLNPPNPAHLKARPIQVTLAPGETLYLPPLWFHEVSQMDDPVDGLCCSLNYWYDMDYLDGAWADWKFQRKVSLLARGMDELCAKELAEEAL